MDAQEERIFVAIIITAVVLGIIIVFFAVSIIRQQRRVILLQKANILAEIKTMEAERSRIAADLHDELGPLLSVIKFQVDYGRQPGNGYAELDKASEQLDEIISRMREIANNLMPSSLLRKGLIIALKEYIQRMEASGMRLKILFSHPPELVLQEHQVLHVYRTLQEVIHNTVKHADAELLQLKIEIKDGKLLLLCRDNGKGFNTDRISKEKTGIGLTSLKNRTEILGGQMITESQEGKGTAFLFTIPL